MSVKAVCCESAMQYEEKPCTSHIECVEKLVDSVSLNDVIPEDFSIYYDKDVFEDENNINKFNRPKFTERDIVDWAVNDIRSVLFIPHLRPEWNGNIPEIKEKGWELTLLPLNATDSEIIDVLRHSCLYKEHKLSDSVRTQLAEGSLRVIRPGCENPNILTLPEWRYLIETYLLNLGCEVQTTLDYRESLRALRKHKLAMMPRTATTCAQMRIDMLQKRGSPPHDLAKTVNITERETRDLWKRTQEAVYCRLGLIWDIDHLL